MPWAKIDDQFHSHPKVTAAGDAAIGLYVRALSYCTAYLTDGRVPATFVAKKRKLAERLVAVGLWSQNDNGYEIHDYLVYNPSREVVLREREAARVRMNKTRSSPEQAGTFARSSPSPSRPVPIPTRKDRTKDRTAVETAADVDRQVKRTTAYALVVLAKERFGWKLTKTLYETETRFAMELLDVWTETQVRTGIERRQKLGSFRYLAEWLSTQHGYASQREPEKIRPAILDEPPLPPEEAAANLRRVGEMAQEIAARRAMP